MRLRLLITLAWLATACGEKGTDTTPETTDLIPVNVQNILTTNCAKSGCHAGSSPEEGMNLSENRAYDHTVNVTSSQKSNLKRILPGDAASSYLVHKIEGGPSITGDRMPWDQAAAGPNGFLTQAEIDTIKTWINNGALPRPQ